MKTLATGMQAHLDSRVTSLCTCWKLTLRDGSTELGFTDNVTAITYDGLVYEPDSAYTPSSVENKENLGVGTLDLLGLLDSNGITESDLLNGVYDNAAVEIFMLNYKDTSQGAIHLKKGWLGEIQKQGETFTAEFRDLKAALSQRIGEETSPTCRAVFGDSRCGVSLASYTATGTATSITSKTTFTDSAATGATGVYIGGLLTWSTGAANAGTQIEVRDYTATGKFVLAEAMIETIATGDGYSVVQGCDKSYTTCRDTYSNLVNFRGEPMLPGTDAISEYRRT